MDDYLSRLLDIDKAARQKVAAAEAKKAIAIDEVEEKRKQLLAENEAEYEALIAQEKEKQDLLLKKEKKRIDVTRDEITSFLQRRYEENAGAWVSGIVAHVTARTEGDGDEQ